MTIPGESLAQQQETSPQYEYEFSGVFTWGEVISTLCRDGWCRTQLPRPFFEMTVPLNIYENNFDNAFKSLSMQAKADGYILRKQGKKKPYTVTAELDEEKTIAYVSCKDTSVHNVPGADLRWYKYADSLKCAARSRSLDSLQSYRDSLLLPSERYRVSFYVVSANYVRSLGVDWTSIWAQGDLFNKPDFITDWAIKAVADNDTTAEFRSVELDVDSSASLHWGSQKKEQKSTVVYSNGVAQQDYEWRNYGLTLSLKRSKKYGIRGEYELAQRDENNSVLRGNFGGGGQDSIVAYGVYDSYQNSFVGIPFLSSFPLIGHLFGHETRDKVKSFFVIQIYRVSRDTIFHDFPYNDSLRNEDIKLYERIAEDTTDNQSPVVDSTQVEVDSLQTEIDTLQIGTEPSIQQ